MHYKDETYHIKVDWETHQILMKCRDNLSRPMAGRIPQGFALRGTADYKGRKTSKPDYRSFIASFGVANIRGAARHNAEQPLSFSPPRIATLENLHLDAKRKTYEIAYRVAAITHMAQYVVVASAYFIKRCYRPRKESFLPWYLKCDALPDIHIGAYARRKPIIPLWITVGLANPEVVMQHSVEI